MVDNQSPFVHTEPNCLTPVTHRSSGELSRFDGQRSILHLQATHLPFSFGRTPFGPTYSPPHERAIVPYIWILLPSWQLLVSGRRSCTEVTLNIPSMRPDLRNLDTNPPLKNEPTQHIVDLATDRYHLLSWHAVSTALQRSMRSTFKSSCVINKWRCLPFWNKHMSDVDDLLCFVNGTFPKAFDSTRTLQLPLPLGVCWDSTTLPLAAASAVLLLWQALSRLCLPSAIFNFLVHSGKVSILNGCQSCLGHLFR